MTLKRSRSGFSSLALILLSSLIFASAIVVINSQAVQKLKKSAGEIFQQGNPYPTPTPIPTPAPPSTSCSDKKINDCCGANGRCVNYFGYNVCSGCPSGTQCINGQGCVVISSSPSPSPLISCAGSCYGQSCSLLNKETALGVCPSGQFCCGESICRSQGQSCSSQYLCCSGLICAPLPGGSYCVNPECANGEKRCFTSYIQECQNQRWVSIKNCSTGCSQTSNDCNPVCSPGKKECLDNNILKVCAEDGSSWKNQFCSYGCENGECRPMPLPKPSVCSNPNGKAGDLRCVDDEILSKCVNLSGTYVWSGIKCPEGTTCKNSQCIQKETEKTIEKEIGKTPIQRYSINNGQCEENSQGPFDSLSACQAVLNLPSASVKYTIDNGQCVKNDNGSFNSYSECQDYLKSAEESREEVNEPVNTCSNPNGKAGDLRCVGDEILSKCVNLSGTYVWSGIKCPEGEICVDNSCQKKDLICIPGKRKCFNDGKHFFICNNQAQWESGKCPSGTKCISPDGECVLDLLPLPNSESTDFPYFPYSFCIDNFTLKTYYRDETSDVVKWREKICAYGCENNSCNPIPTGISYRLPFYENTYLHPEDERYKPLYDEYIQNLQQIQTTAVSIIDLLEKTTKYTYNNYIYNSELIYSWDLQNRAQENINEAENNLLYLQEIEQKYFGAQTVANLPHYSTHQLIALTRKENEQLDIWLGGLEYAEKKESEALNELNMTNELISQINEEKGVCGNFAFLHQYGLKELGLDIDYQTVWFMFDKDGSNEYYHANLFTRHNGQVIVIDPTHNFVMTMPEYVNYLNSKFKIIGGYIEFMPIDTGL